MYKHLFFIICALYLQLRFPVADGFLVSQVYRRTFGKRGAGEKNDDKNNQSTSSHVAGKSFLLTCTSNQEEHNGALKPSNRRDFFSKSSMSILSMIPILNLSLPNDAYAAETINSQQSQGRIQWAPLEALLPATRVRILIQKALQYSIDLETSLQQDPISTSNVKEIFQNLSQILAPPLQNQEMKPNKSIQIAFDTYTTYLRYDDSYTLNVTPQEKSKMIRQDLLPDVKQVIQSDLDLRDLYRNAVMSRVDDARAELRYLLGIWDNYLLNGKWDEDLNAQELVTLLQDANSACNDWFHLISEEDVNAALNSLLDIDLNRKE
ncbi:hypothetical protein CTEN210_11733 [Chaetoceros tenuissimus]|uniref:Uncharacterized protein n=1 Tax=Chaetoceros tenuissimus TaxID=426638 RepID=A0AAD3CZV0_9STRA|nr:hypothetical protein CTEN210_11733 [Chaetoceros tenuissimus]